MINHMNDPKTMKKLMTDLNTKVMNMITDH